MNSEKARMLTVGDQVIWARADAPPLGRVIDRDRFGVTIEWSDGKTTTIFFNDMKYVETAHAGARDI
jgi:hypothetical protein